MNGIYDLLNAYRQENDPRFTYDGLYEEPAYTGPNLDPMYNIGQRQFGNIRAGNPYATEQVEPFEKKLTADEQFEQDTDDFNYSDNQFLKGTKDDAEAIYGYATQEPGSPPMNPFDLQSKLGLNLAKLRAAGFDTSTPAGQAEIDKLTEQQLLDIINPPNTQNLGIMQQAQPFEFLSSAYEDQDEDAEQVDYLPGQERSGIEKLLQYLPFGEKSVLRQLTNLLPKMSPEAQNIRNFYGSRYGLTPTGQVASGIMKGYNPVSGSNLLNRFTGGLVPAKQIGLAPAIRRRIDRIANRKIAQTDASRAKIQELQDIARADTISRARQSNPGVYEGRSGGFDTSAADRAGTSAGSGQGFSNKTGRGRTGY